MATPPETPLGILAGNGELPHQLIQHCLYQRRPFFVIAFEGQTEAGLVQAHPHLWAHPGEVGKIVHYLKVNSVTQIVMAGAIRRPSLSGLKMDWKGAQWLAKIGARALGDDGLLQNIISLLKSEGFDVIGAPELLDKLLAGEGELGALRPDEQDWQDIARGKEILKTLAPADVGQAVVVQQGLVLGIEAIEGTESLLARCGPLRREGRGGVLVKMAKCNQSDKADLPTIGLSTLHQAQIAGLRGIAFSAHSTQILNKGEIIKAADRIRLYIVGIPSQ